MGDLVSHGCGVLNPPGEGPSSGGQGYQFFPAPGTLSPFPGTTKISLSDRELVVFSLSPFCKPGLRWTCIPPPPPPGRTSCSPTDYASFWHFCCCWTERISEYQTKGIESASSPESLKSLPWGTWSWFMCGHGASSEQGSQTLYFSLNIYLFMAASVLVAACVIFRRGARAQ